MARGKRKSCGGDYGDRSLKRGGGQRILGKQEEEEVTPLWPRSRSKMSSSISLPRTRLSLKRKSGSACTEADEAAGLSLFSNTKTLRNVPPSSAKSSRTKKKRNQEEDDEEEEESAELCLNSRMATRSVSRLQQKLKEEKDEQEKQVACSSPLKEGGIFNKPAGISCETPPVKPITLSVVFSPCSDGETGGNCLPPPPPPRILVQKHCKITQKKQRKRRRKFYHRRRLQRPHKCCQDRKDSRVQNSIELNQKQEDQTMEEEEEEEEEEDDDDEKDEPIEEEEEEAIDEPTVVGIEPLLEKSVEVTPSIHEGRQNSRVNSELLSDISGKNISTLIGQNLSSSMEEEEEVTDGWTESQEAALQNAYFLVRPAANFWREIAKRVPGKSAKECFDRFYSAHPTPPLPARPRPRPRRTPVKPLSADSFLATMTKKKMKKKAVGGKQAILKAHRTVRQILRRQQSADKGYEADLFPQLEGKPSAHPPLAIPNKEEEKEKTSIIAKNPRLSHIQSFNHSRSHSQSVLSPEVLKKESNPERLDKYLDMLHLRQLGRKSRLSLKSCQVSARTQSLSVGLHAAKAAVIAGAKEVLKTVLNGRFQSTKARGDDDDDDEDDGEEDEEEEEEEGDEGEDIPLEV